MGCTSLPAAPWFVGGEGHGRMGEVCGETENGPCTGVLGMLPPMIDDWRDHTLHQLDSDALESKRKRVAR